MKTLLISAILLLSTFAPATEAVTKEGGEYVFNTAAIIECETKSELAEVLKDVMAVIPELTDTVALEAFLNLAEAHAENVK